MSRHGAGETLESMRRGHSATYWEMVAAAEAGRPDHEGAMECHVCGRVWVESPGYGWTRCDGCHSDERAA